MEELIEFVLHDDDDDDAADQYCIYAIIRIMISSAAADGDRSGTMINDCDGMGSIVLCPNRESRRGNTKNQISLLFHGSEESDLILCQSFILSDSSFFAVSSDDGIINHLHITICRYFTYSFDWLCAA